MIVSVFLLGVGFEYVVFECVFEIFINMVVVGVIWMWVMIFWC